MTQKTFQMTANGMKKMPGWFSWRHQTRDAHDVASADYQERRGRTARQRRAAERLRARENAQPSTPEERPMHGIFLSEERN